MKKLALVGAAATLLSLGLFGCNNTAEGVNKDATDDTRKVASAASDATTAAKITTDKAVDATKTAAANAADATKTAAVDAADATKKAAVNAEDATKKVAADASATAKQAADATAIAAKNAADATETAAKNSGKNITAATEVTPKVKLAIDASDLNDTHNKINVDSADGIVHLKGSVANAAMKKEASTIAMKTLKDMNATDKVSNELSVTPH